MIGTSETKILPNLLIDRRVPSLRKGFVSNSSVNAKLSKTEPSNIIQSGGFLGWAFGPLKKVH